MSIREEFDRAVRRIMLDFPLLAMLLRKLRVIYVPGLDVPALASPREIVLSDGFLGLDMWERCLCLIHEALHLVLNHPERCRRIVERLGQHVRQVCYVAADVKVWQVLEECGFSPPSDAYTPRRVAELLGVDEGLVRSLMLEELVTLMLRRGLSLPAVPDISFDVANGVVINEGNSLATSLSPSERGLLVRELVLALRMAGRGFSGTGLVREVQGLERSLVDWRSVLRSVLVGVLGGSGGDVRRLWSRQSRKVPDFPMRIPLSCRVPRVFALVDVSGSVTPRMYAQMISEVAEIARRFANSVILVAWDEVIREVVNLRGDIESVRVHGFGNTVIHDAVRYVLDRVCREDVVVVFSDFFISDLEEVVPMFLDLYRRCRRLVLVSVNGLPREKLLGLGLRGVICSIYV